MYNRTFLIKYVQGLIYIKKGIAKYMTKLVSISNSLLNTYVTVTGVLVYNFKFTLLTVFKIQFITYMILALRMLSRQKKRT